MHLKISQNDLHLQLEKTKNKTFPKPTIIKTNAKKALIIGDIHGDLNTFTKILETIKTKKPEKIFFLGDIVDRGRNSLEILYIMLKIIDKEPNKYYWIKGNHETKEICSKYGFLDELRRKNIDSLFYEITGFFETLPYGAILNNNAFLVHGGIAKQPENDYPVSLMEIERLPKLDENNPVLEQLLWNDPVEKNIYFAINHARGIGYYYGEKAVNEFLTENNLNMIIRAHEVVYDGVKTMMKGKVVTVFSSADYYSMVSPKIIMTENNNMEIIDVTKIKTETSIIKEFI